MAGTEDNFRAVRINRVSLLFKGFVHVLVPIHVAA